VLKKGGKKSWLCALGKGEEMMFFFARLKLGFLRGGRGGGRLATNTVWQIREFCASGKRGRQADGCGQSKKEKESGRPKKRITRL